MPSPSMQSRRNPQVVIDWKSDVDPSPESLEHYHAQVRAYLDMTGTKRGLIVAVTSGTVYSVARRGEGDDGQARR